MNFTNIFSNVLKKSPSPFLTSTSAVLVQQTRNTFILKRRHPIPQFKKNGQPGYTPRRHRIYDLVEDTTLSKKKPIDMILTTYVDSVGDKGDRLTLPPMKAYNQFLLPGLAVYATPENIKRYSVDDIEKEKAEFSSPYAPRTINVLSQFLLNVVMSYDNPWTLEKWHVRSAFRKAGVYLNDECITMPERPISGPNLDIENKEFYVIVTLNKREKVNVRCRIHHWSNDKSKSLKSEPDFYLKPSDPIYPEDKAILDSMPKPFLMARAQEQEKTIE